MRHSLSSRFEIQVLFWNGYQEVVCKIARRWVLKFEIWVIFWIGYGNCNLNLVSLK